jgi:hypothetical protein
MLERVILLQLLEVSDRAAGLDLKRNDLSVREPDEVIDDSHPGAGLHLDLAPEQRRRTIHRGVRKTT